MPTILVDGIFPIQSEELEILEEILEPKIYVSRPISKFIPTDEDTKLF